MSKIFEFWCRNCGMHYYKMLPELSQCKKRGCHKEYLELAATVEISEAADGVMGMSPVITSRTIIDSKHKV